MLETCQGCGGQPRKVNIGTKPALTCCHRVVTACPSESAESIWNRWQRGMKRWVADLSTCGPEDVDANGSPVVDA